MKTFEDIAKDNRDFVDAARRSGKDEGLRALLAELYPDNAHFIYELLQNAEDAGAREVSFDLRADGLHVEHDGARLFNLEDIESITGIGQSTKVDDAVAIGKFGVGFKAVFTYTQTPVVQSGEYSFAIQDLFVPERVASEGPSARTIFWFPFDRPDKPAARAVEQVERSLREISQSTLLFLNNITIISCSFPNGDERLIERKSPDDNASIIAIESIDDGEEPSEWYRITGDAIIGDQRYPVAAAFALGTSGAGVRSIQPVIGQVFIYFPAMSENSGLRFHIHAPFASTVARDSVRDDEGNDELIAGIASLVAAELPTMFKAGLITDGLLEALPNHKDSLRPRYESVRAAAVHAFESQPITPAAGGRAFAESRKLIRSASQIRAALEPADVLTLQTITEGEAEAAGWLQERSGQAQDFLDSLQAVTFGRTELTDVLERVRSIQEDIDLFEDDEDFELDDSDETDHQIWSTWLAGLGDDRLRGFYAALGRMAEDTPANPYPQGDHRRWRWSDPLPEVLPEVCLVRVRAGGGVNHVIGREAHLPATRGAHVDGLVLDTLAPIDEGVTKAEEHEANALRQFYSHADVKAWDEAAQLSARFGAYQPGEEFEFDDHVDDLRALAQLLKDKVVRPGEYQSRAILLGTTVGGELTWANPANLCLDEPYVSTGLRALRTPLAGNYLAYDGLDIVELAGALGARQSVEVVSASPKRGNAEFQWGWSNNERNTCIARDWVIPDFDAIVATADPILLRTLLRAVAFAPADRADAAYRANNAQPWHRMRSQVAQQLSGTPWILDRYGNLNLPREIDPADLDEQLLGDTVLTPETFELAAASTLLGKVGFGAKRASDAAAAAVAEQRRAQADETAQRLGFEDAGEAERFKAAREKDPEAFARFLADAEMADLVLPEGSSSSPGRRADHAAQGAEGAQSRTYVEKIRRVRLQEPGHKSAARNYLRQLYTNPDETMVCQICDGAMPFKVGDDYYFEAVQFVKDAIKDLQENRLALCPTCAAKYRHALGTSLDDLRDDLLTQDVDTQPSIKVAADLAGEEASIRFVGKHAIDLQAVLMAIEPKEE